MSRYEVTHAPHFIAGRLRAVGEVVELPAGVDPGRYLKAIEPSKPAEEVKPRGRYKPDA